jgi:hypothetical protein
VEARQSTRRRRFSRSGLPPLYFLDDGGARLTGCGATGFVGPKIFFCHFCLSIKKNSRRVHLFIDSFFLFEKLFFIDFGLNAIAYIVEVTCLSIVDDDVEMGG